VESMTPEWWRSCATASTTSPRSAPLSPGQQALTPEIGAPSTGATCATTSALFACGARTPTQTIDASPDRARSTAPRGAHYNARVGRTPASARRRRPDAAPACRRGGRPGRGRSEAGTPAGPRARRRAVVRGRARGARRLPPAGALRRARPHRGRPVPLAAHPRRDRPAPDRRGPPRAAVGRPRRPRPPYDTLSVPVTGTSFAVYPRPRRPGHRRLRRLGRLDPPSACWAARSARCSCPAWASAPATSSGSSAGTACGGRSRTPWRSPPRSRRRRRRS
jgi:hypothetical protein